MSLFGKLPEDVQILVRQYTQRLLYLEELHAMIVSVKDYQIYTKERVELLLNKIKQKWSDKKLFALHASFWTLQIRLKSKVNPKVKRFIREMGSDGYERVGVIFEGSGL